MPEGPAGMPRPIATSSVNILFDVSNGGMPSEVVVEQILRQKMREEGYNALRNLSVTVNEANDPNKFHVTVVTDRDDVTIRAINSIWSAVEDHIGTGIDEDNVHVRAT